MVNRVKNIVHTSYPGAAKNIVIIGLLILLALTYMDAKENKREVLAIYVGEKETRLITSDKDPILQKELVNFVKNFVEKYYSYSNHNIRENMELATDLMSEKLFRKKQSEINESVSKVLAREYSQKARLRKLTKKDNGTYEAVIDIKGKAKMSSFESKYGVEFVIQRTQRTKNNKYGLEIAYVKENRI